MFRNTQCLCGVVDVVLHNYVNKLSWPLLTLGTYRYIINLLPEAIRYHLQTCYVYGVLLTLPCTYIPTFMVTSANIR